jgi:hypothetical protein
VKNRSFEFALFQQITLQINFSKILIFGPNLELFALLNLAAFKILSELYMIDTVKNKFWPTKKLAQY